MTRIARFLFGVLLVLAPNIGFAHDIPNDGFVTDAAGILESSEEQDLESMLTEYQKQTSNEIALAIIPSLKGEDIAEVAVALGRDWGIGTAKNDNGILILFSYGDSEVFIATGYGLEGAVPDIVAQGVIQEDMIPHFREGNFAEGFRAGIEALQKHIGGEYTAERYAETEDAWGFSPLILFFVFILLDMLAAFFGRTKSWWLGGVVGGALGLVLALIFGFWLSLPILVVLGLLFDYLVSRIGYTGRRGRGGRGGWWGGMGGFGGRGGGGFGGFGGGSFGGGGARGRW